LKGTDGSSDFAKRDLILAISFLMILAALEALPNLLTPPGMD